MPSTDTDARLREGAAHPGRARERLDAVKATDTTALDAPPSAADAVPLRWAWRGALAVFVLAGSTGALFRFAVAVGDTFGLDPTNVRHAHSHLMYFGWATPALFALIARRLPGLGARAMPHAGRVVGAAFALALLAYPPFLLFGYAPAEIGDARLPLSVMAAGFNVIVWYAFAVGYRRARRDAPPSPALRLFDLAVFFLVLATLGAWGLPVLQATGEGGPALKTALTHLFLDVFSEGWFVFGVLGLAAAEAWGPAPNGYGAASDAASGAWRRALGWATTAAAVGVPFTFALGMPPSLVPPFVGLLARVGGALVGGGLVVAASALVPRVRGLWRVALGLLALKGLGQAAVSVGVGEGWAAVPAFRILYLHLMLLGFVTLGLVAAAHASWGGRAVPGRRALASAVGVLLLSLVPLTPLWPSAWGGRWVPWVVAACALGPVLAAGGMAARAFRDPYPERRHALGGPADS